MAYTVSDCVRCFLSVLFIKLSAVLLRYLTHLLKYFSAKDNFKDVALHQITPLPWIYRAYPSGTEPIFYSVAQWPISGIGRPIVEASRWHTQTQTPGRTPLSEWSARRRGRYPRNNPKRRTSIVFKGFKPAIPTSERPQTYALERGHWDGLGVRILRFENVSQVCWRRQAAGTDWIWCVFISSAFFVHAVAWIWIYKMARNCCCNMTFAVWRLRSEEARKCAVYLHRIRHSVWVWRLQQKHEIMVMLSDLLKRSIELRRNVLHVSLLRPVVTICTIKFTIYKSYVLPTQCIYVFCVDLRTNSYYFPIQH